MNDNHAFAPLPEDIRKALGDTLPRDKVKYREQAGETIPYVDGYYVTNRLNEVFGYRWSFTHTPVVEVARYERDTKKGKNLVILYEVQGRLEVPGGIVRGDVGLGVCDMRADNPATGIEKARKEAVTDALKRTAKSLGQSLGLALYDKTRAGVGLSTMATNLLGEVDELESAEAIKAWIEATAPIREKLDDDETAILHGAVVARRRALKAGGASSSSAEAPTAKPPTPAPAALPAPAPAPAPPPAAPALDTYKARVAATTSLDHLLATHLELAPTVESHLRAAGEVLGARAAALGAPPEELKRHLEAARALSRDPAAWAVVAAVLGGLAAATTKDAVTAVVKTHGAKVSALPQQMKDRLNDARTTRLKALAPAPVQDVAAQLEDEIRRATTIPDLDAIAERVERELKAGRLTADQARALAAVHGAAATALEQDVAA